MTAKPLPRPWTTEDIEAAVSWQDNYPHEGEWNPNWSRDFYRWLNDRNPWPLLDVRYEAAKAADLGNQLRPDELTERVKTELANAFAAGALWQYGCGQERSSSSKGTNA